MRNATMSALGLLCGRPRSDDASDTVAESGSVKGSWKTALASVLYQTGLLRIIGRASRGYEFHRANSSQLFSLRRSSGPKFAILCYHRVGVEGVPLYSQ